METWTDFSISKAIIEYEGSPNQQYKNSLPTPHYFFISSEKKLLTISLPIFVSFVRVLPFLVVVRYVPLGIKFCDNVFVITVSGNKMASSRDKVIIESRVIRLYGNCTLQHYAPMKRAHRNWSVKLCYSVLITDYGCKWTGRGYKRSSNLLAIPSETLLRLQSRNDGNVKG